MYENYSRQVLPNKEYRALIGSAICVFNSNNSFIIENILSHDDAGDNNWNQLLDLTSGRLIVHVDKTITLYSDETISTSFAEIVEMRNRILHSFQTQDENGEQILATKTKEGRQFIITYEYLYEFVRKNEELSTLLHEFRGH